MKQVFINLPVKDLLASVHFYTQLGFVPNPLFSFEDQKCMAWSDQILVMLQNHEMFQTGNGRPIAASQKHTSSSYTLPVTTEAQMNSMVEAGLDAGGSEPLPMVEEAFMKVRSIADLDGHLWGIICLNLDEFRKLKGK